MLLWRFNHIFIHICQKKYSKEFAIAVEMEPVSSGLFHVTLNFYVTLKCHLNGEICLLCLQRATVGPVCLCAIAMAMSQLQWDREAQKFLKLSEVKVIAVRVWSMLHILAFGPSIPDQASRRSTEPFLRRRAFTTNDELPQSEWI